jgi:2'-5' RNA ligase
VTESPNGRRVLVAIVTGAPGEIIQAWRERYDPVQALRLPPHATLCYWVNDADLEALGQQVRHAFPDPVEVRLGDVHEFTNRDGTFYVGVGDTAALDQARERFFDGSFLTLQGPRDFTWHVTCVRYPDDARREELRLAAVDLAREIAIDPVWRIDTVACLELRGDRYNPVRTWSLDPVSVVSN